MTTILETCKNLPTKLAFQLHTGEIFFFDGICGIPDKSTMCVIMTCSDVYAAFYPECTTLRPWVRFRINIPRFELHINHQSFLERKNMTDVINRIFQNEGKRIIYLKNNSQSLSSIFEHETSRYYEDDSLPINCLYKGDFNLYRQDVFFAIDGTSETDPECPFLRIHSDHQSVWQAIHMLENRKTNKTT